MRVKLCAIRDSAVDDYGNIYCFKTTGEAVRAFSDLVQAGDNNNISKHPNDYELFVIGEFDTETAEVIVDSAPRSLIRGADLVKAN